MSSAIIGHAAGKALQQVAKEQVGKAASPAAPDAHAVKAFETAMPGPADPAQVSGAQPAHQARHIHSGGNAGIDVAGNSTTMGDRILGHLDQLRANEKTTMQDVRALQGADSVSPEDMLRVKMEVDQLAISEQMTVKGVTVVENDLKQLLKQQ